MIELFKTFTVRLYPTDKQIKYFNQAIGNCRFLYNKLLYERQRFYNEYGFGLTKKDTQSLITDYKKLYPFLNETCNQTLVMTNTKIDIAYQRYFKGLGNKPKFKSKKNDRKSFPIRCDLTDSGGQRMYLTDEGCFIPKLSTPVTKKGSGLGLVKFRFPRSKKNKPVYFNMDIYKQLLILCKKPTTVTIYEDNNKWFLTMSFKRELQETIFDNNQLEGSIGIDLGLKDFAVTSNGDVFKGLKYETDILKYEKKLKRYQRKYSHKYECNKSQVVEPTTTNEMQKLLLKIKKLYKKIRDIRKNYLHHVVNQVVKAKPQRIVIEDLNVKGMMRNKHISKHVSRQSFYLFKTILSYKAKERGIELVVADRYYPSSKNCSNCGTHKKELKLKDRIYHCTNCNLSINRDLNASINLANYNLCN